MPVPVPTSSSAAGIARVVGLLLLTWNVASGRGQTVPGAFDDHFQPRTMRVDYFHTGGMGSEIVALDRVLSDGDSIAIDDDLSVRVIATPGHTRDSLSYYLPEKKILFASEAVGLPDHTGYIYID